MSNRKKRTVLLVGDNNSFASKMKESLESLKYSVIVSDNVEHALKALKSPNSIEIVLVDFDMRGEFTGSRTGIIIAEDYSLPLIFLADEIASDVFQEIERKTVCSFITKNASLSMIDSSIKIALKCFEEKKISVKIDDLIKSEKKYEQLSREYEAILDHIPALIFYKDKENRYIYVNRYVADAHKKKKDELEGVSMDKIYPADQAAAYFQDDLEVINSGKSKINIEEPWRTAEMTRWVNTSKIPFINDRGEITGVIGISLDITDRKLAELQLKLQHEEMISQKEFYQIILNSMTDWVVVTDKNLKIIFYNSLFHKYFDLDESAMSRNLLTDIIPSFAGIEFLKDIFLTGTVNTREFCIEDKNGYKCWSISASPVFSEDMSVINAVISGRDITLMVQQKEEIVRSREILNRTIHLAPIGIVITDSAGNINFVNRTFEDMSGYYNNKIKGGNISLILNELTDDGNILVKGLANSDNYFSELKLLKADLDYLAVKVTRINIEKPIQPENEIILFITDISFEKKLETKQVRLQNHIESIIREMDDLSELLLETNVYNQSIKTGTIEFEDIDKKIIKGVEAGLTNKQIASKLNMAEVTIKKRLSSIYLKVGVSNKYQLLEYIYKNYINDK